MAMGLQQDPAAAVNIVTLKHHHPCVALSAELLQDTLMVDSEVTLMAQLEDGAVVAWVRITYRKM